MLLFPVRRKPLFMAKAEQLKDLNLKVKKSVLEGIEKEAARLPIPTTRNLLILATLDKLSKGEFVDRELLEPAKR